MNEGEVRFVTKAYDYEGRFIDSFSYIAEDVQDVMEHDNDVTEFMESALEQNERMRHERD